MNIKDIEVGMYIRFDEDIGKVCNVYEEELRVNTVYGENDIIYDFQLDDKVKASHNIIDVIEVGDYVNGCKVASKDKYDDVLYLNNRECSFESTIFSTEIKSIVTKEHFERGEFKP